MKKNITKEALDDKHIIFFDGYCGLCNFFVDLILEKDKKQAFLFSPIQGETYTKLFEINSENDWSTVVLYHQGKVFVKSSAVLKIISHLPSLWKLTGVFWIIPRFLRDVAYNYIAKNRIKWFGNEDSCRIPTEDEKNRFLP